MEQKIFFLGIDRFIEARGSFMKVQKNPDATGLKLSSMARRFLKDLVLLKHIWEEDRGFI